MAAFLGWLWGGVLRELSKIHEMKVERFCTEPS
jgi:hypothetical protein